MQRVGKIFSPTYQFLCSMLLFFRSQWKRPPKLTELKKCRVGQRREVKLKGGSLANQKLSVLPHMLAHAQGFVQRASLHISSSLSISFCVTSTRLLNSGEPAQSGRLISVDLNIAKMISADEISRYHAVNAQDAISYWYEIAWVGCSASNPTEMKKKMARYFSSRPRRDIRIAHRFPQTAPSTPGQRQMSLNLSLFKLELKTMKLMPGIETFRETGPVNLFAFLNLVSP